MTTYIIRRLLHALLVVLIVSLVVFIIMRQLPGDPILMYVSSGDLQAFSQEQVDHLRHELGLDRSWPVQYLDWLSHAVRGDLGKSILNRYDVLQEIGSRIPTTFYLGLLAFVIGCLIGPLLGVVSAVRRGRWLDSAATIIANLGITAPPFWIGAILIYVFGLYLGLLPVYGYTSPLEDLGENLKQSYYAGPCIGHLSSGSDGAPDPLQCHRGHAAGLRPYGLGQGIEREGSDHGTRTEKCPHAGCYAARDDACEISSAERSWLKPFSVFPVWASYS